MQAQVHTHAHTHTHRPSHLQEYSLIQTHTHTLSLTHTHKGHRHQIHTHTHTHTHTNKQTHTRTDTQTQTQTDADTHTHTHTHTQTKGEFWARRKRQCWTPGVRAFQLIVAHTHTHTHTHKHTDTRRHKYTHTHTHRASIRSRTNTSPTRNDALGPDLFTPQSADVKKFTAFRRRRSVSLTTTQHEAGVKHAYHVAMDHSKCHAGCSRSSVSQRKTRRKRNGCVSCPRHIPCRCYSSVSF